MLVTTVVTGCGGGTPLMHPAHPIARGDVLMGAGFSATKGASAWTSVGKPSDRELVEAATVAPGLAPWVAGRIGFGEGSEAGLTYTGRAVRIDGRRVWALSSALDLSLGVGATGLLPQRQDALQLRVGGEGADVPVLLGWRSAGELYSLWLGARAGGERLRGERELPSTPGTLEVQATEMLSGWHSWAGGLVGLRIGFRHVFAVLEVDGAAHWVRIDLADRQVSVSSFAVAPAAALIAKF